MSNLKKLRAAVIGAGHMGNYHAQKLAALPDVDLVAVVDADLARAQSVAASAHTAARTDFRELLRDLDCAFVATPTEHHFTIARACLEAGVHTLVEKPITKTVEQAQALVALANERSLVLQVGHAERYNAAFTAAQAQVKAPRYVEAHRLSPFRTRGTDIDVVLDLMIHDIDLTLSLVPSSVREVHAMGSRVLTEEVDIANARISFANGCVATLTASRVSAKPMRKIRVFAPHLYVSVDCMNYSLQVGRTGDAARGEAPIVVTENTFEQKDSLLLQATDFVAAVRERRTPRVSGLDGARALELALNIKEKVEQSMRDFQA